MVDNIKPTTPVILIDDNIADHLQEDEVLLLPGKMTIKRKNDKYIAKYKMNEILVDHIKSKVASGGGKASKADKALLNMLSIPKLSLRGKAGVFYR
jgi:hypothetical protein